MIKPSIRRVIYINTAILIGFISVHASHIADAQQKQNTPGKAPQPSNLSTPIKIMPSPNKPDPTPTTPAKTTPAKTTPAKPATPANQSGIPEETQIQLVNQFSDQLAAKITNASCPELGTILDQVKNSGSQPTDPNSLVGKLLEDIKSNPKLKSIIVQKMGGTMVNRLLDCNMVPMDLIRPGS